MSNDKLIVPVSFSAVRIPTRKPPVSNNKLAVPVSFDAAHVATRRPPTSNDKCDRLVRWSARRDDRRISARHDTDGGRR